ncbi:MAG: RHS repeat-associated core domain-containing protein, partial [Verrucomicrobiota bacterium]
YVETSYNNLDVVTGTMRLNGAGGTLLEKEDLLSNWLKQTYRTIRHAVNISNGSLPGQTLEGNTWYDLNGNVIEQIAPGAGEVFTKTDYDHLDRQVGRRSGYTEDGNEMILAEETTVYDVVGHVLSATNSQRNTGSGTFRKGHVALWYDPLGREIARAVYGVDESFERPSAPPAGSDEILISSTVYNEAGEAAKVVDPMGTVSCRVLDAAGRPVREVQNASCCEAAPGDRYNVTIDYTYTADSQLATTTARKPDPADDEVTTRVYGTTLQDSDVASNLLLRAVEYPDSGGPSDRIEFRYNRQNQVTERRDQAGTVHQYDFDLLGRTIQDRVTAFGTGIDGSVVRLQTGYEARGMVNELTNYDNADAPLNQVEFAFNNFAQLITDYQEHNGDVNTGSSLRVSYQYAGGDGGTNQIRPTAITYPNGRQLNRGYGDAGSMNDRLNRVESWAWNDESGAKLATYRYLGMHRIVRMDYPESDIRFDLWGGEAGSYTGLDRFGRVRNVTWEGPSGDLVNLNFGFDRNSNRIYRQNLVADATPPPVLPSSSSSSSGLPAPAEDQSYAYDELNRLTDFQIGRLSSQPTAGLVEKRFEQQWGLDAVGNWDRFDQSSDGGPIDLEQTRDHNEVNEITGITNDPLPSWSPPAYDAAGNTTSLPRPDDLTNSYTAVFDAWNRLVRLSDGSDPVTEYDYDGRGYRITRRSYTSGNLDETRELYYSSRWQVLEERVGGSVKEHYVWGLNTNGLIVRDRDVGGSGFDERLYVLQDALFSVVAVADATGAVLE